MWGKGFVWVFVILINYFDLGRLIREKNVVVLIGVFSVSLVFFFIVGNVIRYGRLFVGL